jgi:hypothetical protein
VLTLRYYDADMNDAERMGYQFARWAHAHPLAARMIVGSLALVFGGSLAILSWGHVIDRPVKATLKLISIAVGCGIILLADYWQRKNKSSTVHGEQVPRDDY